MSAAEQTPTEPAPADVERYQRDAASLTKRGDLKRLTAITWLIENGLACHLTEPRPERPEEPKAHPLSQGIPRAPRLGLRVVGTVGKPADESPHNPEAEETVVSASFGGGEVAARVAAAVSPKDLYRVELKPVLAAVLAVLERGASVDAASVVEQLRRTGRLEQAGGAETVAAIAARDVSPESAAECLRIVLADSTRRTALESLANLRSEVLGGVLAPAESAARARELVETLECSVSRVEAPEGYEPAPSGWPAPPAAPAWRGIAGETVQLLAPHTEADPVAVLAQVLVCFGSVIGRNAHWLVDATRHHCNEYLAVVGRSSKARKGTSYAIAASVVGGLDATWRENCIQGGLSSGEGLVHAIRDPSLKNDTVDHGVSDKRLLCVESELSSMIGAMNRDGSTLSGYLRDAWDGKTLRLTTKNNPLKATNPHVSLIGHTTLDELRSVLTATQQKNGFANRFLWVCARRARLLPHGGDLAKISLGPQGKRLARAISFASNPKLSAEPFEFDAEARELYGRAYAELSRERPVRYAPMVDRAEAHVRRLAVIYAALDCSKVVKAAHLNSALAMWDYCERSAAYVFGAAESDAMAERVLSYIKSRKDKGALKNDVNRDLFGGRRKSEVEKALEGLVSAGLIEQRPVKTGPRQCLAWFVSEHADPARCAR